MFSCYLFPSPTVSCSFVILLYYIIIIIFYILYNIIRRREKTEAADDPNWSLDLVVNIFYLTLKKY